MADTDTHGRLLRLMAPHGADTWLEWPEGSPSWVTRRNGGLSARMLHKGHPIGLIPNREVSCWFAVDLDHKTARGRTPSRYHPASDPSALPSIRDLLSQSGIEGTITVGSSSSGGIHLWAPIPNQPTMALAIWLRRVFSDSGYVLAPGVLELFPNVPKSGSNHQGIRVPLLSPGSAVLDPETLLPVHHRIEAFCDAWERCLGWNDAFRVPTACAGATGYFRRLPEAVERLQRGFTAAGQTNELAGCAAYVGASEGLSGAALRSRMCALLARAPGCQKFSGHWNENRRGTLDNWWRYYSTMASKARAAELASSRKPKTDANPRHNDELAARKRYELASAAMVLRDQGITFDTVTAARTALIAEVKRTGGQMSINTVMKHPDIVGWLHAWEGRQGCEPRCTEREITPQPCTDMGCQDCSLPRGSDQRQGFPLEQSRI